MNRSNAERKTAMPKSLRTLSLMFFALTFAATSALAQPDAEKAFTAIKNLPGIWEGKASDGHTLKVSFRTFPADRPSRVKSSARAPMT
jgi:hypothetical protein